MVKVPIVMGEVPAFKEYGDALRHLLWVLLRTEPTRTLTLRVVATFVVAKGDFVFDAMPVLKDIMLEFQRLSDAIHKRALGLPRSFSRALLHRPLRMLGLHAPPLGTPPRGAVRRLHDVRHQQSRLVCIDAP